MLPSARFNAIKIQGRFRYDDPPIWDMEIDLAWGVKGTLWAIPKVTFWRSYVKVCVLDCACDRFSTVITKTDVVLIGKSSASKKHGIIRVNHPGSNRCGLAINKCNQGRRSNRPKNNEGGCDARLI